MSKKFLHIPLIFCFFSLTISNVKSDCLQCTAEASVQCFLKCIGNYCSEDCYNCMNAFIMGYCSTCHYCGCNCAGSAKNNPNQISADDLRSALQKKQSR